MVPTAPSPVLPTYTPTARLAGGRALLLARDRRQRLVLLKVARSGPGGQQAFTTEARVLAGCRHPGIVRLLDIDATRSGRPFLVLEAVSAKPLRDFVGGGLTPPVRQRIRRQLDEALAHLHARGHAHRRLDLDHILLAPQGPLICGLSGAALDLPSGHPAFARDRLDLARSLARLEAPRTPRRWFLAGLTIGLLATVALAGRPEPRSGLLEGYGSGTVRLRVEPGSRLEIRAEGTTRIRLPDQKHGSRRLQVTADTSGLLPIVVDHDNDEEWLLRYRPLR